MKLAVRLSLATDWDEGLREWNNVTKKGKDSHSAYQLCLFLTWLCVLTTRHSLFAFMNKKLRFPVSYANSRKNVNLEELPAHLIDQCITFYNTKMFLSIMTMRTKMKFLGSTTVDIQQADWILRQWSLPPNRPLLREKALKNQNYGFRFAYIDE